MAESATDADAAEAATSFAHEMATFWEARLGHRLLGVYLIGSLAHGGFSRRYSDIDMGLVAEDGLSHDEIAAANVHAQSLSPEHAKKLSLFWGDRGFTIGRFPPLDRVDLVDHAIPLIERDCVRPPRPTREEIRQYLRGQPFAAFAEGAAQFAGLDRLAPENHKPYLRAHLYPARFVLSWLTGGMASNDDAVALTRERAPAGFDIGLIGEALHIRHEAADPDPLFPARASLRGQAAACARLMES